MGTANDLPASRMPRRLPKHMTSTTQIEMMVSTSGWLSCGMLGMADATAAVPAAICTATVTT